ncbi:MULTISPECIES: helix-turn-helix transcriptional regulator [unclassified Duganella]|uniref:helix-turn-helix domain-containing protein n=1 Tax=unclassified Duganella TaxID=2636909 RepID=UPI000B7F76E7|nr:MULTISPECIES: helix-turn-helix transcriptional regulator [unclassified Duganella]
MTSRKPSDRGLFGRRLRQARLRADLPQDQLGVLAGLEESSSSARISRYESGIHEPPVRFAESLAKVLGVSAAFFYCADDRLAEIILLYADMSESKRRLALESAQKIAA